jgi:putative restriction endonuclease
MSIDWYKRLAKLRVDKASKNPAPHKPLLLLAILDQIEDSVITSNTMRLTPELAFHFLGYWEIVSHRGRGIGRAELPFFYLQSDGFLKHVANQGLDVALGSIKPTSIDSLNKIISYAEIPEEFFELMQNKENRNRARRILILGDWFFPDERMKLLALLNLELDDFMNKEIEIAIPKGETDFKQSRDIKFRFQIVPLYRFSCVLCGIKMLLPSGITLVEAAHIHQFAHSRNDDITNGIALCRNHHWAFDQGLWTIDQEFKVMVACGTFTEQAINQPSLESYHAKQLDLSWIPLAYRPSDKNFEWHRKSKFLGQKN